ncbi:MarR family winged helix-turn-helix transcriptional regulator [Streptomyces sp. NPDC002514]|uniref:MarR family winged helix-turn-helix transcriptional regulator n=1 Tax=Streptomyces sp. NPDC001270 TaxID=3364554 RepID=UPI0036CC58F5
MEMEQESSVAPGQGPGATRVPEMHSKTFHLMRRVLQEHGAHWQGRLPHLTKPQYAVLRAVGEQPGIEQSAVAVSAGIDKATLAAVLLRLEQRGLIIRTVDLADRRRRLVHLTEEGDQEIRQTFPVAAEVDAALLDRLTPKERTQLQHLLAKLTDTP